MNGEVRATVNARRQERHMSRADLTCAVGKTPQESTRALHGSKNGGSVPPLWEAILTAFDLKLTAEPDKRE